MSSSERPNSPSIVGYFDSSEQSEPVYDPPHDSSCPVCKAPITPITVKTVSFRMDDERSYFYRLHRMCYAGLNEDQRLELDETMMLTAKGLQ